MKLPNPPKTLLTIAGHDPSSGAGITADLAVFAAHGFFGTSCVTALTVQSTLGVAGVHPVSGTVVRSTLECLEQDLPPDGIKIGMLSTAESVDAVAEYLQTLAPRGRQPFVVLDPVVTSTSGAPLLEPEGLSLLRERLLPLVQWATPNRAELAMLLGRAASPATLDDLTGDARALARLYPHLGIVVTGGDRQPPDDLFLMPSAAGAAASWLTGEHVTTQATHGTGCAFSSALLCGLVSGSEPLQAARAAKAYVAEAMRRAVPIGGGNGPLNHLWPLLPAALKKQSPE